ncbi:DedA family protein [Sphingosinicella terrae]|uniref:DedA family protein n=1 Tax=Sphingosinicella terrae TaxID=2172047 RepID=UPI000E0D4B05|nr:DedA family protein [Sphingosinicella terrae]
MGDWVIRLIDATGYVGIFLLMLLETVFPPVPSEVIMPVAGVRAASGSMGLWGVIVAGTAGAMTGNIFWYLVARWIGLKRFCPFIEKHGRWLTMDWYDVERVERLFGRFGSVVVAIGRLIPTIRSVVSIPAGLVHMQLVKFLAWSTLGTAVWSGLLALGGYLLGQRFDKIDQVLGPVSSGIVTLIVILYIYRQITWSRRHREA